MFLGRIITFEMLHVAWTQQLFLHVWESASWCSSWSLLSFKVRETLVVWSLRLRFLTLIICFTTLSIVDIMKIQLVFLETKWTINACSPFPIMFPSNSKYELSSKCLLKQNYNVLSKIYNNNDPVIHLWNVNARWV